MKVLKCSNEFNEDRGVFELNSEDKNHMTELCDTAGAFLQYCHTYIHLPEDLHASYDLANKLYIELSNFV